MRARGLKLSSIAKSGPPLMSRPMRARGLKRAVTAQRGLAGRRAPCGRVD